MPPRRPDEMSRTEVRDRWRDSPARARSLLTVRAAISSARDSERPCRRSDSLTCSYWRARFVPFFTPRGGMDSPCVASRRPTPRVAGTNELNRGALPGHQPTDGEQEDKRRPPEVRPVGDAAPGGPSP